MDMVAVAREPRRRFVYGNGIVEYSEAELEAMGQGCTEAEFDSLRYAGLCPQHCVCGRGACPIL